MRINLTFDISPWATIFSFLTRPTEFRFAFGLTGVTRIRDTHDEGFVLIQVRNVNRQNELDGEREAARG